MADRIASRCCDTTATRIHLNGLVQGVGMRPYIARLAEELRLTGCVYNANDGIVIEVEGSADDIEACLQSLQENLPQGASVQNIHIESIQSREGHEFEIEHSIEDSGPLRTTVPPDRALCQRCRSDIVTPDNRRFGYPFTSCTACGPRYSLLHSMPWDRVNTSMSKFPLCPKCDEEYNSAADGRFHSQTQACPECGPNIALVVAQSEEPLFGRDALEAAAHMICTGSIIAIKGIGGYQLLCDATSTSAVNHLRHHKQRARKPFAVMVPSLAAAERYTVLNHAARTALTASSNPIVLVDVRETPEGHHSGTPSLSASLHPNLRQAGIMLPTTPLHLLLLNQCDRPCVVTSGNTHSDPIVFQDEQASQLRGRIADAVISHDRDIVRPVDDSVVRVILDRTVTLRCGRGLAPMPLPIETEHSILAIGAHQKVALALSNGRQAVLGPHIGDLDSLDARQRFIEQTDQFCSLYRIRPTTIVHDLHPDLFTTRWASEQNCRTVAVQHHHAHIVSAMVENHWLDRSVLGIALDGTGYGTDGTIWGGEILLCTTEDFRRIARLRPFCLPGGERAIREPWRIALALLHDAIGASAAIEQLSRVDVDDSGFTPANVRSLCRLLDKSSCGQNSSAAPFPVTSSAGRLFDGVASLLFDVNHVSYEGEAAVRLESQCLPSATGEYHLEMTDGDVIEIDWRPLIRQMVRDRNRRISVNEISTRFIRSIAGAIAAVCGKFCDQPVVLSGGCFQNAMLTEETHRQLVRQGNNVGLHELIPPNDGGLAAGQLAIAAARLRMNSELSTRGGRL